SAPEHARLTRRHWAAGTRTTHHGGGNDDGTYDSAGWPALLPVGRHVPDPGPAPRGRLPLGRGKAGVVDRRPGEGGKDRERQPGQAGRSWPSGADLRARRV